MDAKRIWHASLKKSAAISNRQQETRMNRFWFFFYGLPNIVGMGAMLVGLCAHLLLVVIGFGLPFWWLFVPALYVFGWLVGFSIENNDADLHFRNALTEEEIKKELDELLKKIKKRIPQEAYDHVVNIKDAVINVLPQLLNQQGMGNQELFTVKKTVFDYLPETLENYIKLPNMYSKIHKLQNGKTADVMLIEQLTIIDTTMQDIVQNIYAQDANKLLTNQRFLEQRMQTNDNAFL